MRIPWSIPLIGCLLLLPGVVRGQTPATLMNLEPEGVEKAASAANPWLGAQLGYDFLGSNDFADSFLVSARILKNIVVGIARLGLPVMGNLGSLKSAADPDAVKEATAKLLQSAEGVNVGLFPYYFLTKAAARYVYAVAHGSLAWKANAFDNDESETTTLNQAKASLGLEVGLGEQNAGAGSTLTVSLALARTWFDVDAYEEVFGSREKWITALELTAVAPVGNNLGFLVESIFAEDSDVLRIGLVIAGDLGGNP